MCNFGFNRRVPWLPDTNGVYCSVCKDTVDSTSHFINDCPSFKACSSDPTDGYLMMNLVDNLDKHSEMLLLLGGLPLPFDQMMAHSMRRFITSALEKFTTFVLKGYGRWGLCASYLTKMLVNLRC